MTADDIGNRNMIRDYVGRISDILSDIDVDAIDMVIRRIITTCDSGSRIYIFGNGGSGTTSSHLACDFNKCILSKTDLESRFVCLNDSTPSITAYANDHGYETIFSGQLKGVLRQNDLVIAISGSGNSQNVIRAVEYARSVGCPIVSMTGFDGGKLRSMSDTAIHIGIDDMQKTEDCHMVIGHLMVQILAEHYGNPLY